MTTTVVTETVPASTTVVEVSSSAAVVQAPALVITAPAPVAETISVSVAGPSLPSAPIAAAVTSSSDTTVISASVPSNDLTGDASTQSAGATAPSTGNSSLAASAATTPPGSDGATVLTSINSTPGDPASDPGSARGPPASALNALTLPVLDAAVTAAEAEWLSVLPGASFAGISVSIGHLPSSELGVTVGTAVTIDPYADGYGWAQSNPGDLVGIDLVTVVAHELGHVLGYGESPDPSNLMYQWLSPGESRTITSAVELSGVPTYDTSSSAPVFQNAAPITFAVGGLLVTTLNVGSVPIGTTGSVTVTLSNPGTSDITGLAFAFASGTSSPFTTSGAPTSISAGATRTLTLSYAAPNVQQLSSDTLVITGTVGAQAFTQNATVTATPGPVGVAVGTTAESALAFTATNVGATNSLTVNLSNAAGTALTGLTFSLAAGSSSPFTITTSPLPTSLATSDTPTLALSFVAPAGIQTYADTLEIQGTWNGRSFTEAIPVSGTVPAPVGVTVNSTSATAGITFATAQTGGSSSTVTATLSDAAGAQITGLTFAIVGANSPFTITTTTPPSGLATTDTSTSGPTIGLAFAAPGALPQYGDTLRITGTVRGVSFTETIPLAGPVQVPLGLTAGSTSETPSATTVPAPAQFTSVVTGGTSTMTLTITNAAASPISALTVSFGTPTFSAASLSSTSIASHNGTATVILTFTAPLTANTYADTVTVGGTVNGVAFTESFGVLATANPLNPLTFAVGSNPVTTLDFGTVAVGTAGSLAVTITNPGAKDISGLQFAFASGSQSPFSIVAPAPCAATPASGTCLAAAGGSASLSLQFAPQVTSNGYQDTLLISGLRIIVPASGSTAAQTVPFTQQVTVTATVPIPIGLTVSSATVTTLDFGSLTVGSTGPGGTLSVTLANQSGRTISDLQLSFLSGPSSSFSASPSSVMTLASGASQPVTLTFAGTGYSPAYLDTLQITGNWAIPAFGSTPAQTVPFTQTVPVTAELASSAFQSFQAAIAAELANYQSGGVVGTHTVAGSTTAPTGVGDVLLLTSPTFTFKNMSVSGSGSTALFTGEIDIAATSAAITSGAVSATFGAVGGAYMLNGQAPSAGTFTLTLAPVVAPTSGSPGSGTPSSITTANLVGDSLGVITVVATDDGARAHTTFGATGAQAIVSTGTSGPTLTISSAALGLVATSTDLTGVAGFALQVTGVAAAGALSGVSGTTLTGSGLSAIYDNAGNVGPVTVNTGSGSMAISLSQPAGTTGPWTAVSGPATVALGSLGSIQGTLTLTPGASSFTIAASGVSAAIAAGTGSGAAAVQISGASGSVTLTASGATSGTAAGQVTLTGSSALTFSAAGAISFSTTPSQTFTISTSGTLEIGGYVGLQGAISVTSGTGSVSLSITSTPPGGSQITLSVQLNPDGTFAADGQVAMALPALLSGVSLGGPVTLKVNTSSSSAQFGPDTVPAASGGGITLSITSGAPSVALAVLITPAGKFAAAGQIAAATPPAAGLALSGQLTIRVNTGSTQVTLTPPGGTATAVDPGTSVTASAGLSLSTPLGVVTGTFAFGTDAATNATKLDVTGATLQLGSATAAGFTVSGNAYVLVLPSGLFAFRATGTGALSGTSPSLTFTGSFLGEFNNTGQNVTLADDTVDTAAVIAGAHVLQGNVTVAVGSFASLTGNFAVLASTAGPTAGEILLGANQLAATVGSSSGAHLTVSGASLVAAVNADHTYALESVGGTVTGLAGITVSGPIGVEYNTSTTAANQQITVGGITQTLDVPGATNSTTPYAYFTGPTVTVDAPGVQMSGALTFTAASGGFTIGLTNASLSLGGSLAVATGVGGSVAVSSSGLAPTLSASSVALNVPGLAISTSGPIAFSGAGNSISVTLGSSTSPWTVTVANQSLSGVFTVQTNGSQLAVSADHFSLQMGSYVTMPTSGSQMASGNLLFSSSGVAADITAPSVTLNIPTFPSGISASGEVKINSQSIPVSFPTSGTALALPAGPFVEVSVSLGSTTPVPVGPAGSPVGYLAGTFGFEQETVDGATVTGVALSNVSAWVGSATPTSGNAAFTNGQGVLVITSAGVAGYVSGSLSGGPDVLVQVNTTGGAVNQSFTIGGRQLSVDFGAGQPPFSATVSNLSYTVGNFATIEGSVTLTGGFNTVNATSPVSGSTFAGTGLTVFFGNGPAVLANGNPNPLAVGLLLTNATVALLTDGTHYAFEAQGTVQLVGVPGVSISGQGSIQLNTFSEGFNESIPAGLSYIPLVFSTGSVSSVGGLGLGINILGETLTADLSVSDSNGVTLTAANAQLTLSGPGNVSARGPPLVKFSNGAGTLTISSDGVWGALRGSVAMTVPGIASLTGTFDVLVNTTAQQPTVTDAPSHTVDLTAGPYLQIASEGTPAPTLTVGTQSISGQFVFTQATVAGVPTTTLSVTNGTASLGAGGKTLSVSSGQGALTITPAGVTGTLSAALSTNTTGFSLSASTLSIALNTTSSAAGGLPAGPYLAIGATGATLNVDTGLAVTGDFSFQSSTDNSGSQIVLIAANNLSASLGPATLSNGSGAAVLNASGIGGQFSGDVSLTTPGVSITGGLSVQLNTSTSAFSDVFTVGGQTMTLSLAPGKLLQLAGTNVSMTFAGQTVTGSLTVTETSGSTTLTLSNASMSLAGGLVAVTGGSGQLTLDSNGATGHFDGTVALAAPGISLNTGIQVNVTDTSVDVVATAATVTIAGQSLTGTLTFTQAVGAGGISVVTASFQSTGSAPLVSFGATGCAAASSCVVSVDSGSGQLVLSSQGVAGELTLTGVHFTLPTGISLPPTATYRLAISTLPSAVNQAFTIGAQTSTLSLPAGPYVAVSGDNVALTVNTGGLSGSLSGSFLFQDQAGTVVVAASGLTAHVGSTQVLTGGQGALVIESAGVAGLFTGQNGGTSVALQLNTTGGAVNQTVTVGGQQIPIQYGADQGSLFAVSVSTVVDYNLGNFVTVSGTVTFTSTTVNGSTANTFAGTGVTIFIGQGPAYLSNGAINPLATGILISNAQVGFIDFSSGPTYALSATGTATVLGVPGVTFSGTVSVTFNNTGAAIAASPSLGFPNDVALGTTGSPEESFSIPTGQLSVLGQTLSGSFSFAPLPGGGVAVSASGASLALGGGALSVTNGNGTLVLGSGGIAGTVSGSLSSTLSAVSFSGLFAVQFNTSTAPVTASTQAASFELPAGPFLSVSATGASLSVLSQTVTGNFVFTPVQLPDGTAATAIGASGVTLSFGSAGSGFSMTGGQGALFVTSAGLMGQLAGTVTANVPTGASLTGTFGLIVNTTANALSTSVTVGGSSLAVNVPAGPYFELTATGATLTVLQQTLSGNFTIAQVSSQNNGSILEIGIAGGSLSLGGATAPVSVTGINGALFLEPSVVAGSLQGTVAVNVPGVTLSGAFAAQFNTGGSTFQDSVTVGGNPVTINVAPGVNLTGNGVSLTALGQTISGNFVIDQSGSGLAITVTNLVANLGGTSASPLVSLTGNGSLTLTNAGLFGSLTVSVAVNGASGVSFGSGLAFKLDFNTTSTTQGLVPPGPFVRIDVSLGSDAAHGLTIAGQSLTSGAVLIELTTDGNGKSAVVVGINGASLSLGGGAVSASNLTGALVLSSGAVAGTLSADVTTSITGLSVSGTFTVSMNTGSAAIANSYEVGGSMVTINLPAGPTFAVQATNASLTVAGVTLTGSVAFQQTTAGTAVAVSGASLVLGDGTENFLSVTGVTGAMLVLTGAHPGVAASLSGNVAINLPGVSVSGALNVELNTTSADVNQTFQLAGASIPVNLSGTAANSSTPGPYLELTGTGVTLTAGGASITGTFSFLKSSSAVTVTMSNAALSFGGGLLSLVQAPNTTGSINIVSGGVYGAFVVNLGFNVPSVTATGTYEVKFNTTGATSPSLTDPVTSSSTTLPPGISVFGSNVNLSVAGEQIGAGSLSMNSGTTSDHTKYVALVIQDLTLQLTSPGAAQPFVNVTTADHVSANLFVSSAGVAGQITGSVVAAPDPNATFNLPGGMTLGASSFTLKFNTGAAAVDEQFSAGTATPHLQVSAGPFLNFEVDGATLSFGSSGPSFSGSFVFAQNAEPSFGSGAAVGSSPGTVSSVAVADVNGDGLPDIVVGVNGGTSELFLNSLTTPGTFTQDTTSGDFPALTGATSVVTAVALADVNNDNRPDLIVATTGLGGVTRVFLNQGMTSGAGPTWRGFASAPQTLSTPNAGSLAVGKLFGSGFNDLVVASTTTTQVFQNKGNSNGTWQQFDTSSSSSDPQHVVSLSIASAKAVAIGDVTGDKLADLVVATAGDGTNPNVYVYKQTSASTGTTLVQSATLITHGGTHAVAIGDLNGDGFGDIVVANTGFASQYFLATSTGTPATWQGFAAGTDLNSTAYNASSVGLADVTGNGPLDVILGVSNGPAEEFLNAGSTGTPATWQGLGQANALTGTTNATGLVLADVHNGALPDIVSIGSATGAAWVNQDTAQQVTSIGLSGVTFAIGTTTVLSSGQGAFVLLPGSTGGIAGTFTGSASAGGTSTDGNSTSYSASASITVRFNSATVAVDQTVIVNGQSIPIVFSGADCNGCTNSTSGPFHSVTLGPVNINVPPVEFFFAGGTLPSFDSDQPSGVRIRTVDLRRQRTGIHRFGNHDDEPERAGCLSDQRVVRALQQLRLCALRDGRPSGGRDPRCDVQRDGHHRVEHHGQRLHRLCRSDGRQPDGAQFDSGVDHPRCRRAEPQPRPAGRGEPDRPDRLLRSGLRLHLRLRERPEPPRAAQQSAAGDPRPAGADALPGRVAADRLRRRRRDSHRERSDLHRLGRLAQLGHHRFLRGQHHGRRGLRSAREVGPGDGDRWDHGVWAVDQRHLHLPAGPGTGEPGCGSERDAPVVHADQRERREHEDRQLDGMRQRRIRCLRQRWVRDAAAHPERVGRTAERRSDGERARRRHADGNLRRRGEHLDVGRGPAVHGARDECCHQCPGRPLRAGLRAGGPAVLSRPVADRRLLADAGERCSRHRHRHRREQRQRDLW